MATLTDTFTSTGAKFFAHEEAMRNLRNGKGQPITTHVMLTDVCNHTCAFCSVQKRAGDSLPFDVVQEYLRILLLRGLKSVILSGGGNPILYKDKESGADFNDVVNWIHLTGLEIGVITNGMPLTLHSKMYDGAWRPMDSRYRDANVRKKIGQVPEDYWRESWKSVRPETIDKLTWVRVSMAGLDHKENEVYVPDIDPSKTTLGFSYVAHDIYTEAADPYHGKVSTRADLLSGDKAPERPFETRVDELTDEFTAYCEKYKPRYLRLLPNCLEPQLIGRRCETLQAMADEVNAKINCEVVFVQYKPPSAPKACYLGYIHPVLNCDGYVYPCDSCVLNEAAEHQFANPWRVCRWNEVGELYDRSVRSLIADPAKQCPGCVFPHSNAILGKVVDGTANLTPPSRRPEHANFI